MNYNFSTYRTETLKRERTCIRADIARTDKQIKAGLRAQLAAIDAELQKREKG